MAKITSCSILPRSISTIFTCVQHSETVSQTARAYIAKWVLFRCRLHFNGMKSLVFTEVLSGHALLFFSFSFSRDHDLIFSWSRHKSCFLVIMTYFSRDLDITKVVFSLSWLIFLVITTYQKLFSRYHDLFFSWSRHNKSCFVVITTYFSRDHNITKVVFSLSRLNFLVIST